MLLFLFFHRFAPPMREFDELVWEFFSKRRETVFPSFSVFEDNPRFKQFCKTIGKNLRICASYFFANLCKCASSIINGLQDKDNPLLSKKSEQGLSLGTCTLWGSNHSENWLQISLTKISFIEYTYFLKEFNVLFAFSFIFYSISWLYYINYTLCHS